MARKKFERIEDDNGGPPITYYSRALPHELYKNVSEKKGPVRVFVGGSHVDGKWVSQFATPTLLAKEIANKYPLGLGGEAISSFETHKWDDGRILTVMHVKSDLPGFTFGIWAGLCKGEEDD